VTPRWGGIAIWLAIMLSVLIAYAIKVIE